MSDVLIIGSEGGIGRAFCDYAESQGKKVLKLDAQAENTSSSWNVDASNMSELSGAVDRIKQQQHLPATVVATPGLYLRKSIIEYTELEIEKIWQNNFLATTNIVKVYLSNSPKKNQTYNFILVSSLAGHFGGLDAYYAASKAAVMAFAKSIAREYKRFNARVNVVAPGPVDTQMADVMDVHRKEHYCKEIPIGRFTQPDEVASLMYYLCFVAPPAINGVVYNVDGGLIRR